MMIIVTAPIKWPDGSDFCLEEITFTPTGSFPTFVGNTLVLGDSISHTNVSGALSASLMGPLSYSVLVSGEDDPFVIYVSGSEGQTRKLSDLEV